MKRLILSSVTLLTLQAHAENTSGMPIPNFDYTPYEYIGRNHSGVFIAPDYIHPKAGIGWSSKSLNVVLYGPWSENGIPLKKTFTQAKQICSSVNLEVPISNDFTFYRPDLSSNEFSSSMPKQDSFTAMLLEANGLSSKPQEIEFNTVYQFWLQYDWKTPREEWLWDHLNPFGGTRPTTFGLSWSRIQDENYVWCVERNINIREVIEGVSH